jgi:tetratricopeptide (TPR) repeat protein
MNASDAVRVCARCTLLLTCAVWTVVAAAAAPLPDPACATVAGRIDGILVGTESRNAVERSEMAVARSGEAMGARNGMPLCFGDLVTTGATVRAQLRLDAVPESEKWLTLEPGSFVQIVDGSSIFLRLGRLFASLRGRFEVRTPFARLGARGTEFQIEAREDGMDVLQLEGSVEVAQETGTPPGAARLDAAPRLLLIRTDAGGVAGIGSSAAVQAAAGVQVDRLTRLVVRPQQGMRVVAAERDDVTRTVDQNCLAIIATRPASPSQSFIRVFDSPEQRASAYRRARIEATLSPGPAPLAALAQAYVDFGEARRAVRTFELAGEPVGTGRELALRLNDLGNAHRLKGDLRAAEDTYRRALAADPVFAFPYNGLGDVFRDHALAAIDRGDTARGEELLVKARELYLHSLDPSLWGKAEGRNRAVPYYNIGIVSLQLAQLQAADAASTPQAERSLLAAEDNFRRALGESPGYAFAEVGAGRVFAARAALYAGTGRQDLSSENIERARLYLERVAERYPAFAVARQALGEALELANDPSAPSQFLRATQLDPSYPIAYFRLARALDRSGRAREARLYYQSYLRIESPVFRGGDRVKTATTGASTSPVGAEPSTGVPPPVRGVVPRVLGMSQADATSALEKAGLAVDTVQRRIGPQPPGTVISQSVQAETQVARGSRVDLVIATPGGKPVKVPDVVGDDQQKATRKLQEKQLQAGAIRTRASCETPGEVIEQNPREDEKVPAGTAVDLVVAAAVAARRCPT